MKAFMIAGTSSGVGKTSIVLGLMRALTQVGYKVRGYKVGPDYIDTGYHTLATGYESINLDSFMVGDTKLLEAIFKTHLEGMDVGIIEGVMGLYDGLGSNKDNASSAAIAKMLDIPVILVVDVKSMSTSAAAYVKGFQALDSKVKIQGVIVNRIASKRHYQLVKESIERYTGVPVVGYVYKNEGLMMPSRHLGLLPSVENNQIAEVLDGLAKEVEPWAEKILEISQEIYNTPEGMIEDYFGLSDEDRKDFGQLTICIAKDEAFHFYYPDNLNLLKLWGVELKYFSPLYDTDLMEADAYYIGGGFPEMFAKQLEQNSALRKAILEKSKAGVPIYGECGGLMYLGETLEIDDRSYQMCGCLSGKSQMTQSLKRFGYTIAQFKQETLLGDVKEEIRGHEFHHSEFLSDLECVATHRKEIEGKIIQSWEGGYQVNQTLGSYLHIHFYQNPHLAKNWLRKVVRLKKERV